MTQTRTPQAAHHLAAIIESSEDVIVSKDLDGVVTSWNKTAERVFGYSEAEMLGTSIHILIPPDRHHEEGEILAKIRAGQTIDHFETIRRRKDGSPFPIALTVFPIKDDTGKIIGASKIARDITERKRADELAYQLAAIVESSDDAIISKNLDGIIQSWNRAAERLFGYSEAEAVGQHVVLLIPEPLRHEEDRIIDNIRRGLKIDHYETVRRRKDGSLVDVALTVSPVKDRTGKVIGASKIARDISGRKIADALVARHRDRFEMLNSVAKALSADLDVQRIADLTTSIATRLTGAKFGAFFYNVTDEKGESFLLFSLHGAPREAFEKFGKPRNTAVFDHTFQGLGPVRSGDIRKDPRYGKSAPHYGQPAGHLPVVSYLAVPVVSRTQEVIGGLFFGHHEPDVFDAEAEELAIGIASHAAIAMDNARLHRAAEDEIGRRRAAEETKDLLLHEIKHRVKNMLVTINSVASQSFKHLDAAATRRFSDRIQALSAAHDLLTRYDWRQIDVGNLVTQSLAAFKDPQSASVQVGGPPATIESNRALLLSLVLHELGTNALKYGAWSVDSGSVDISWRAKNEGKTLDLVWRETGGPPVTPPTQNGFGSKLINRAMSGGGAAKLDFEPTGVVCRISLNL